MRKQGVVRQFWFGALMVLGVLMAVEARGTDTQTLVVSEQTLATDGLNVLQSGWVLRDPQGELGIDEILALRADSEGFLPLSGDHLRKGFSDEVFWVHFRLALASGEARRVFLVAWPPFIDRVDLYAVGADGGVLVQRAGDHVPVAERALAVPETVFPLELSAEPTDFFLRVESSTIITLSAVLKDEALFAADSLRRSTRHGIFLGMIATAILIAALAAVWLRQRVFVLASAYLVCFFGFQFIFNGNDQIFIYPERPWLGDNLIGVFAGASAALMAWFAMSYLDSRPFFPRLTLLLNLLAMVMVVFALVALAGAYHAVAPAVLLVMLLILVLMLGLFFGMLQHKRSRAVAMLVMFVPVLTATLFQILHNVGIAGSSQLSGLLWNAASLSQMPFAAVAILLRVREDQQRLAREASYQMLVENQVDLVVKLDLQSRLVFVSSSYSELFGEKPADCLGQSFIGFVHEDDRPGASLAIESAIEQHHPSYAEHRARTARGWRWLGWSTTPVLDGRGKVEALISVGRDVTDRVETELALQRSRRQLDIALDAGRIGFYSIDLAAGQIQVDDRCKAMLGYRADELEITWDIWKDLLHPDDRDRARALTESVVFKSRKPLELEYRISHRDGSWLWLLDRVTIAESDPDGQPRLMAGLLQDITRRKQAEDQLEFLVSHDELTGLLNRRGMVEVAQHHFEQARRDGRPCAFAMVDLDFFKKINDSQGHEAGDEVLRKVSKTMLEALRVGDWLGRWGGEEFLVILPGCSRQEAMPAMERLRRAVEAEPMDIGDQALRITVSIGVVPLHPEDDGPDSAIARADAYLYQAKRSGRNRVCGE